MRQQNYRFTFFLFLLFTSFGTLPLQAQDPLIELLENQVLNGEMSAAEKTLDVLELRPSQDPAHQMVIQYAQGEIAYQQARRKNARHHFVQVLSLGKGLEPSRVLGRSHLRLGIMEGAERQDSTAQLHLKASLDMLRELKDTLGTIAALKELGGLHYTMGREEEGEAFLQEAMTMARQGGHRRSEATILSFYGQHYFQTGAFDKGLNPSLEAIRIFEELEQPDAVAKMSNNLGIVLYRMGQPEEAEPHLQKALALSREHGYLPIEADALVNIAVIWQDAGAFEKALEYHMEAYEIYRTLGADSPQSIALSNIAQCYEQAGQHAEAIRHQHLALEIDLRLQDTYGLAIDYFNLGDYHRAAGQYAEAIRNYHLAEPYLADIAETELEIDVYTGLYESYKADSSFEMAIVYREKLDSLEQILAAARPDTTINNYWRYLGQQKDEEISSLEDKTAEQGKLISTFLWVLALLAVLLGLGGWLLWRKRKQEKAAMQAIGEDLEAKSQALETARANLSELEAELAQQSKLLAQVGPDSPAMPADDQEFLNKVRQTRIWPTYMAEFELCHPRFYHDLQRDFPELTAHELRLLSLVRLGLNTPEIADFLSITQAGVKKARQRIRKKAELPASQDLTAFLLRYGQGPAH